MANGERYGSEVLQEIFDDPAKLSVMERQHQETRRLEEGLGSLTNRPRGEATALGPTVPMRIGAFLNPMLERVLDIFPEDNPYGSFLERLVVGSSPERTEAMKRGHPHQYTGRGPNDPLINPEIVDLLAAVPAGTALKAVTSAAPFLKAAAVPAGMVAASQALTPIAKGGRAVDDMSGLVAAAALQRAGTLDDAMVVYHASPHEWEVIDPTKIGTGQGAQSFGHGIYVAQKRGVAKQYEIGLGRKTPASDTDESFDVASYFGEGDLGEHAAGRATQINMRGSTIEYVFDDESILQIDIDGNIQPFGKPEAHFYEIDVPDEDIAKMLDWDAPFNKQPEALKKYIRAFDEDEMQYIFEEQYDINYIPEEMTGGELHSALELAYENDIVLPSSRLDKINWERSTTGKEAAAIALEEAGIPGIKYLDQGSRGGARKHQWDKIAQGLLGKETRNMVLFDDLATRAKVLKRNEALLGPVEMPEDYREGGRVRLI
jgi:hypothetical protein